MAVLKLPSLRSALDRALSGIRTGFDLFPVPAQDMSTEVESFISRLEEVLELETAAVSPASSPWGFNSTPANAATPIREAIPTSEPDMDPVVELASHDTEELWNSGEIGESRPSVTKANDASFGFTRGLKPPPPSESSFSEAWLVAKTASAPETSAEPAAMQESTQRPSGCRASRTKAPTPARPPGCRQ